jgi:hypothetical protein
MARPLNELLTAAYADLTREFDHAPGDSRDVPLGVYANVLRHLRHGGVDVREIPKLAAISKRAAKWDVSIAKRHGWVVDGHDELVQLSDAGTAVLTRYERAFESAEAAWRKRCGKDVVQRLRSALTALVRQFDLELPHHPTGYGPADGSVTGGVSGRWGRRHALRVKGLPGGVFDPVAEHQAAENWEKDSGGRLYVRDTGQDWRPVQRHETDAVDRLSLFALLSQAVMAFAIDYEGCGGLAMARSGNFLRRFGDDGLDIALRQARSGGSTVMLPHDGTLAALERHAYASLVVDPKNPRLGRLTLTEKGAAVRDAYDEIVMAIEKRWKRRYGAGIVREVRSGLTSVSSRASTG